MNGERENRRGCVRNVPDESRQYVQNVLRENNTLRSSVVELRNEKTRLEELLESTRRELEQSRLAEEELHGQVDQFAARGRAVSEQYLEVEHRNANLAALYVASYRLHSTLDRRRVLETIQEIVINLIGSEQVGVFEAMPVASELALVSHFGIDASRYARIPFGSGLIGRTAVSGETYMASNQSGSSRLPTERDLTACIPLKVDGKVLGAIAIFKLLEQKSGLQEHDIELFDLLGTQAATALYAAKN